MISFEEALTIVRTHRWQSTSEKVSIANSGGRRLATEILAELDAPPYTNSAMDGFCVGSVKGPWKVIGSAPAGSIAPSISPGQAIRINTGSLIPSGGLAVLPQEEVEVRNGDLWAEPVRTGANIRKQAEEYATGTNIFQAGTRITPPVMSAVAAHGIASISVHSMPRVALLSTGAELLQPGEPYITGRVYESNSVGIAPILDQMGCVVTKSTVTDNAFATEEAVRGLLEQHDLIITIGGVSVGDFDFVRPSIIENGFELMFSGVAIKPGKPVSFGVRGDGKAWFGLPGNPMSALVTFCLFVRDYLGETMKFHHATNLQKFTRKPGRLEFVPALLDLDLGGLVLNPTVGSHATRGLAGSTGLARISGEVSQLVRGDIVAYSAFPWSTHS